MRVAAALIAAATACGAYKIGVGKADATSSLTQTAMMGYANPSQHTGGLHTRIFARAFVVADDAGSGRIAFVSLDAGMPSVALRKDVDVLLNKRFTDNRYHTGNVMISGTHTHSGPGGFFEYFLFQVTSDGYVPSAYDAFAQAITDAIAKADAALQTGTVSVSVGKLPPGSNINRSPTSYLENPAEERAKYPDGDTDRDMVQLRFDGADGKTVGLFNWFAIHGTAMNFTNYLVNGDTRGLASQKVEQKLQSGSALPGQEDFVAAFASTNLGDVSPNTAGMVCHSGPAAGQPCDIETSTCPVINKLTGKAVPRSQPCYMLGPGRDMFDSTHIQAQKQIDASLKLAAEQGTQLSGPVGSIHQYLNMPDFKLKDGNRTCSAGLGYAFAAGTVDGPGDFDFHQHQTKGEKFWDMLTKDILNPLLAPVFLPGYSKPTDADYACHLPKPVLLFTGKYHLPWHWHPDIVELQLFRIGNFFIAGVPGEFTTMAGRRLRAAIAQRLAAAGVPDARVVIAGLSNQYTHYITTPEEYRAQRYEAASTLFGPHTYSAYEQQFEVLAEAVVKKTPVNPGTPEPTFPFFKATKLWPPKIKEDKVPAGSSFGAVITDAEPTYTVGPFTMVNFSFYGANLRNNAHQGGSFFYVQRSNGTGWVSVANDHSESTRLVWEARHAANNTAVAAPQHNQDDPADPMRHLWGPMLHGIGAVTGRKVHLGKVQQCHEQGRAVDIKRLIGDKHHCSLIDVTVPTSAHPMKQLVEDVSSGKTPTYSAITVQWQPALDQAPAGSYRIAYAAEYTDSDGKQVPFQATSRTFQIS